MAGVGWSWVFPFSPVEDQSRLKLGISLSPSGKVRVGFCCVFSLSGRLEWVLVVYFHPSGSMSPDKTPIVSLEGRSY